MTAEDRKGMKDAGSSNVSHVSRKLLQCIDVTTPVISHVVEVTFRNHYNAYDLFSNGTRLSFSLFNGGKNNVIFQTIFVGLQGCQEEHDDQSFQFLPRVSIFYFLFSLFW